jgi:hypothetical protein
VFVERGENVSECLKNKALYHYLRGHNCSQCVLKAAEGCYQTRFSRDSIEMCEGINNGFGVGATCSVLVAGLMLFSVMLDADEAKRARMMLFSDCCAKYGSLDCAVIKKYRKNGKSCEDIVGEIAGMIENVISGMN